MIGKQWLLRMLSSGPVLPRLRERMLRECVTVLMYHELAHDDADLQAWTVVRKSEFLRQIDYLRRHYDIVSLDDALARMQSGASFDRPPVVLTFDDGDSGNYEILLSLVESLELPVAVFVATGQVQDQRLYWFDRLVNALQGDRPQVIDLTGEGLSRYVVNKQRDARSWTEVERLLADLKTLSSGRREEITDRVIERLDDARSESRDRIRPLTVAEVKALGASRWVRIGAHSHCHNLLTQIPWKEAEESIAHSRELLRRWTGQAVRHFAYPSGDYNAALMQIVERLGFSSALTTEETLWRASYSPFRVPRIGVGRYDSIEAFKVNVLGGIRPVARQFLYSPGLRGEPAEIQ